MFAGIALFSCGLLQPARAAELRSDTAEIGDTLVEFSEITGVQSVVLTENDSTLIMDIHGVRLDTAYTFRYEKAYGGRAAARFEKEYGGQAAASVERRAMRWDFGVLEIGMSKSDKSKHDRNAFVLCYGLGFGWVNAYDAAAGWNFRMGRSFEIFGNGLGYSHRSRNGKHQLMIGLGAKFTRLVLDEKQLIDADDEMHLMPSQYPEGYSDEGASLNIASCYANAIYTWNFAKRWSLSFSPAIEFNTNARVRSHYTIGKRTTKTTISGVKRNVITGSFLASLSYRNVGLYAKYSPWSAIDTDFGPKTASWSMGVSFFF